MGAELNNIPVLDGWVNLTEAAEMIGITRQHAHKKARFANEGKANGWKTIHRVGSKPMYVVSIREVEELKRKLTSTATAGGQTVIDIRNRKLTPEDREAFLREWGLPPETSDKEILLAIGLGHF